MTYLAEHGFPVPTVYHAAGTDLIMRRVPGPTLSTALLTAEVDTSSAADVLAELHQRLHRVPARTSRDPASRVLHLDLHPGNVILGPGGPVLIDWRNNAEGAPDLDTAMTALIIAQAAVGDEDDLLATAHALLPAFLDAVGGRPRSELARGGAARCRHQSHAS
jgi:aminoglycoside phosphotransferase (APT) family kinase protein